MQRSDGSFGVWNDTDDTVPWLDAYATDFLIRAKEHGKNVPDFAIKAALGWLRDYVRQEHTEIERLAGDRLRALRAGAGQGRRSRRRCAISTTRRWRELPTQLAKAQLAAALAQYGDTARAAAAYDAALGAAAEAAGRRCAMSITAANLRDSAAVLAFAAGNPGNQAAADRDHRPHRRAASPRASAHQHAGAGLAADGGRGGGARPAAAR